MTIATLLNACWTVVTGAARQTVIALLRHGEVPQHMAFIMDGNRRFARKHQVAIEQGHRSGFDKLEQLLEWCLDLGVKVISVYAFSIENFKRPAEEVAALMELIKEKMALLCEKSEMIRQHDVRIRIIGHLDLFPLDVREACEKTMRMTEHHQGPILNVCMPYTSRDEMTTAIQRALQGMQQDKLLPSDIDEDLLEKCMYTGDCPPVDVLVRTSGEVRLSDYLLWQVSENCLVHFVPELWPELSIRQLLWFILDYQSKYTMLQENRKKRKLRLEQDREEQAWRQVLEQGLPEHPKTVKQLVQERDARVAAFFDSFVAHKSLSVPV